jgi:hypothetical protein
MSTLVVVEEVLRERGEPMVVREIVAAAAERLPTRSKTPDTVVARDLAMDIKKRGEDSKFTRVAPGLYTLRELVMSGSVAEAVGPPLVVSTGAPERSTDAGSMAQASPLPVVTDTPAPVRNQDSYADLGGS